MKFHTRVTKPIWDKVQEVRTQGGRQGGKVDVWAYMKGLLKEFFKTDPCAREFRQRSIIALNMGMCTLNARPPKELKVAIFTLLGDTFRGIPRREVVSGGGIFGACVDDRKRYLVVRFPEMGEVPNSRMHAQACPLVT